jgi:hypothetical protein
VQSIAYTQPPLIQLPHQSLYTRGETELLALVLEWLFPEDHPLTRKPGKPRSAGSGPFNLHLKPPVTNKRDFYTARSQIANRHLDLLGDFSAHLCSKDLNADMAAQQDALDG